METPLYIISIRLLTALVLGALIGLEREYRAKVAGVRTHFLVALGSALFCVVSQYGFGMDLKDSSRVAAQVVSGIGFLGAGTIIFHKNVVRGLTTAAGLWVTAAIGLACGTGMYAAAIATTFMVLVGLEVLHLFLIKMETSTMALSFSSASREKAMETVDFIRSHCVEIISYSLNTHRSLPNESYEVTLEIRVKRSLRDRLLADCLQTFEDVRISSID